LTILVLRVIFSLGKDITKEITMKIYLDDLRIPPKGFVVVRNYNEFVEIIKGLKEIDCISFDHDLGEEKTGYDCMCIIEEKAFNKELKVNQILVHTTNPSVRHKMVLTAQKIIEYGNQE